MGIGFVLRIWGAGGSPRWNRGVKLMEARLRRATLFSYVLAVFVIEAVFALFIFDAELCPLEFVSGSVLLYANVLELLELADCFEQAAFYSLLVTLEPLDYCWAVEVGVDYGAELDFCFANVGAARWGRSGVYGFVYSRVGCDGSVFVAC